MLLWKDFRNQPVGNVRYKVRGLVVSMHSIWKPSSETFTLDNPSRPSVSHSMRFSLNILAILATSSCGVIADCTWPYCVGYSRAFFYACDSDADCHSINRTSCTKGLESPTPSGTVCFPWNEFGMANITYVTVSNSQ